MASSIFPGPLTSGQLFIGPGYADYFNAIEVLDLTSDPPLPCSKPSDYPIGVYGASGAFIDEAPIVCGGFGPGDITDQCYR